MEFLKPDVIATIFKNARGGSLPGVEIHEIFHDEHEPGARYGYVEINKAVFRYRWPRKEIEAASGDRREALEVIAKPAFALRELYENGIAEGRKREREAEIRMLRTKQENAYRALRYKAMADAWNAIAQGTTTKPENDA